MSIGELFFSYSGRIPRLQYWLGNLAIGMVFALVLFGTVGTSLSGLEGLDPNDPAAQKVVIAALLNMLWIAVPLMLLFFWCSFALAVKRLHDRNRSGWWVAGYVLVSMIPFINILAALLYLIELGFLAGTPGGNRFGPDPLDRASSYAPETGSWADSVNFEETASRGVPQQSAPVAPRTVQPVATSNPGPVSFGRRGLQT